MKFSAPLLEGVLLKRYKRFLADVRLLDSGETILVHVPNSGSMRGVNDPDSPCRVSLSPNPSRKIPYTLEMVYTKEKAWVGVNTSLTNKLVMEAFKKKAIPEWERFTDIQAEVKINDRTRLDFVLSDARRKRYVEVKNVSMAHAPVAVFPDAVTERGQKHLKELMKVVQKGHEGEILFIVQREDCRTFRPCDEIDPEYGKHLRQASKRGVRIRCWACSVSENEIKLRGPLPVLL